MQRERRLPNRSLTPPQGWTRLRRLAQVPWLEPALVGVGVVLLVLASLTTGGQVLEAAQALKDAGAKVDRIVAVIDRLEGARENIEKAGYSFEALFDVKDLGVR